MTLRQIPLALAVVVSLTFLFCGGLYAGAVSAAAPLVRVTIPTLRSVADRGPFLPDFEELLGFAATQIPQKDGILPSWGRAASAALHGSGSAFRPKYRYVIIDGTDAGSAEARHSLGPCETPSGVKGRPSAGQRAGIAQEFVLYRKMSAYDVCVRR
jgi:hypothetical protein